MRETPSKSSSGDGATPALSASAWSDRSRIAGNYQCGQGHTIRINHAVDTRDPSRTDAILLTWQGAQHRLSEVKSASGAARFENQTVGLLWIMIPGKAMLLSSKLGHPLANDCRL